MSLPRVPNTLGTISKLDDRPNDTGGLTAAELKAKFDKDSETLKKFLNNTLIPYLESASAAAQLGIKTIPGFSAADIQTALEQIVKAMQDVTQGSVTDGSITLAKLAADVTAAALGGAAASHTHGAADVSSGVLDIARIPALTGDKLPDGIVTNGKIGAAAVTSEKLAALAVLAAHIAQGAVTGQKIANKTITADNLADGTIVGMNIQPKTLVGDHLADKTITAAQIADGAITPVQTSICSNCAGAHNSIFRGWHLGSSVTAEQWEAISNGGFDGLYIGDYWTINGVTWRIAAFDYYLGTGTPECTAHHAVIVPDTCMYTAKMNAATTTTGGYAGSQMRVTNLAQAKTTISAAFGENHILSHRQYLCNAVTNGKPSGGSWYDSAIELMTERNVYGSTIFGVGNDGSSSPALHSLDRSQFPLFAHAPSMMSNRQTFWLRDVVSGALFARTDNSGNASADVADGSFGVRPAFAIKA